VQRDQDIRHTVVPDRRRSGQARAHRAGTYNAKGSTIERYSSALADELPREGMKLRIESGGAPAPDGVALIYRHPESHHEPVPNNITLNYRGNRATPTGSEQCESTANLLKSVVPDAVGERFGTVELVA